MKHKVSSTAQHFVIRHSLFDILRFELRQANIQYPTRNLQVRSCGRRSRIEAVNKSPHRLYAGGLLAFALLP